ncbi:MAG: hypothetical protein ACI88H_002408 [Cocleimonas sp.]|jgi:hypothetical protein
MNLKSTLLLLVSSLFITACSSPIVTDVRFENVTFDPIKRATIAPEIDSRVQFKIVQLTAAIMNLGPDIDKKEANFVAREAVLYSMHLANEYKLVAPPNSQNVLVNTGKREKGLCYHFARDMSDHIVKGRTFNTLTLKRAVAFQGKALEHNVLTVAAKGKGVNDAIILDAWRESAKLYFVKTVDDPMFRWKKYTPQTY